MGAFKKLVMTGAAATSFLWLCVSVCPAWAENVTARGVAPFNCKAAEWPMRTVCSSEAATASAWKLTTAYWAAYYSRDAAARPAFRERHVDWQERLSKKCGREKVESVAAACVAAGYDGRSSGYVAALSGDALHEATAAPDFHFLMQQKLVQTGNADGPPDGIFGLGTREAIARFQRERGDAPTGFLTASQIEELSSIEGVGEDAEAESGAPQTEADASEDAPPSNTVANATGWSRDNPTGSPMTCDMDDAEAFGGTLKLRQTCLILTCNGLVFRSSAFTDVVVFYRTEGGRDVASEPVQTFFEPDASAKSKMETRLMPWDKFDELLGDQAAGAEASESEDASIRFSLPASRAISETPVVYDFSVGLDVLEEARGSCAQ